ncbi:unnamed protein product, partial [Meganyctiphanes norvegica]
FTVKLATRRMTQKEFKRAHGDLGKLLDMMDTTISGNEKSSQDKNISNNDSTEEVKSWPVPPWKKDSTEEVKPWPVPPWQKDSTEEDKPRPIPPWQKDSTEEDKPRPIPPWQTTRKPWNPTADTTPTTTTTTTTTTTSTTTTPSTTTSFTPPKLPPTFGFRPGKSNKVMEASKIESSGGNGEQKKGPIPIKLDIATLMKETGISAADMLHDLGSLFTLEENESFEKVVSSQPPIKSISSTQKQDDSRESATDKLEVVSTSSSKPLPYVPPRSSKGTLRPYRRQGGSEVYKGRYGGGEGRINNRYATTKRTTQRTFQYRPLPPGAPRPPGMKDFHSVLDLLHNSTTTAEGEDISFNLPGFKYDGAIPGMETILLKEKVKESEQPFPIYDDDDPNALNNSTKSAILAASILGGVAMLVFLAILLVVMFKNHVRPHRRSLRAALPVNIPSDTSSTGTPPLYSSNVFTGRKGYKTSGFWGTLKKRFDPYSISSTPTTLR